MKIPDWLKGKDDDEEPKADPEPEDEDDDLPDIAELDGDREDPTTYPLW